MKNKTMIILSFIIFIFICYHIYKYSSFIFPKNNQNFDTNSVIKNKYMQRCNLVNEIIDMKFRDNERQCYYDCGKNIIERVDTSIAYPCQKYILEGK